jgi:hypothetical protein
LNARQDRAKDPDGNNVLEKPALLWELTVETAVSGKIRE